MKVGLNGGGFGHAFSTTNWKNWIEKMYAPDYEPNTEDEDKLLTLLSAYLENPDSYQCGVVKGKRVFMTCLDISGYSSRRLLSEYILEQFFIFSP